MAGTKHAPDMHFYSRVKNWIKIMNDQQNDEKPDKPENNNTEKFTWHEGEINIIKDPKEVDKIWKEFLRKRDKQNPENNSS